MNRLPLSLVLFCVAAPVGADDWPQWRGPTRDGVWRETGLRETLPEGQLDLPSPRSCERGYFAINHSP